jgi:hypothetical protein
MALEENEDVVERPFSLRWHDESVMMNQLTLLVEQWEEPDPDPQYHQHRRSLDVQKAKSQHIVP